MAFPVKIPGADPALFNLNAAAVAARRVLDRLDVSSLDVPQVAGDLHEIADRLAASTVDVHNAAVRVGNAAKSHEHASASVARLADVCTIVVGTLFVLWAGRTAFNGLNSLISWLPE